VNRRQYITLFLYVYNRRLLWIYLRSRVTYKCLQTSRQLPVEVPSVFERGVHGHWFAGYKGAGTRRRADRHKDIIFIKTIKIDVDLKVIGVT
jgi:hypothetical protein